MSSVKLEGRTTDNVHYLAQATSGAKQPIILGLPTKGVKAFNSLRNAISYLANNHHEQAATEISTVATMAAKWKNITT